ncbi:hypothetical protein [Roseospira visakhapatnamensis]|uniref:Uncharacterized protein n=1 Tax=Roseospira visakhapatnamensis TaxID=390880 RepID=A0A7W6W9P1_9PROT|nr:hypothetical protein [Roseospira visakhapatnamensis]MBB4266104.1 hypothetical protein [Roseospira visakhapatnamensis]
MGQFATLFVPVALQAATTAWTQYEQHALYEQQRQEQALANQASAEAARRQAEASAQTTIQSAAMTNQAAWDAHDLWTEDARRQSNARIADMQRDYGLSQQDQAEALRRASASERARFAGRGLDAASGSARALLSGLESDTADATRRAWDDLAHDSGRVHDATSDAIRDNWQATADQTRTRAEQANLDVWGRQADLDLYLYNLGVQSAADQRQDLLDLTLSNQRALLGLTGTSFNSVATGLQSRFNG